MSNTRKNPSKKLVLFEQSAGFRATGRGYYNKLPNFPANENNANSLLHNKAVVDNDPQHKIWMFCTAVNTGWQVQGSTGQSQSSRAFYPQHLVQLPITIEGICANQFEYDRLVDFIQRHHETSLKAYDDSTHPLEFKLFPYQVKTGERNSDGTSKLRTIHDKINCQGYITNIRAGHERFVNAPTFQLEMMIAFESKQDEYRANAEIDTLLKADYLKSFGEIYAPKKAATKASPVPGNKDSVPGLYDNINQNVTDEASVFMNVFSDANPNGINNPLGL